MTKIGKLGEQLVAQWLEAQGWIILHHRWHCTWGEIDLIAQPKSSDALVFVEVKTRSGGNWDADGLLAITSQKQTKLCRTAALFLAEYPDLANFPCRFDVALVSYRRSQQSSKERSDRPHQSIILGKPIFWEEYQLTLQNYIESAFDGDWNQ